MDISWSQCIARAGAAAIIAVSGVSALRAACPTHQHPGTVQGSITSPHLIEASGIAVSRMNPGVIWAHNDSGDSARLFAMSTTGQHLGIYTITGASAIDWEDVAVGSGPSPGVNYLYIGDIGDNLNVRSTVRVYRIAEPSVDVNQTPVTQSLAGVQVITLRYPDGPRDAETLMIDTNGDIYIVSKRVTAQGRVYRAAFPQSTTATITMEYVAQLPWGAINGNGGATGGDISSDGSAIVIRRASGNPDATLWRRSPGSNLWDAFASPGCDLTLNQERQGEAIAFAADSLSIYTLSEGSNQPLLFYPRQPRTGDVTGDDLVGVADLLAVIANWGRCAAPPLTCPADIAPQGGGDGAVGVADLLMIISFWG